MTRTNANLVLLLAGAIWGMGFVAQSTAMEAVGPWLFIGLRFALATLTALPIAIREHLRSERPVQKADWFTFAFVGLLLFAGMGAQQVGLLTTSVTNSGFLTGLYVVFTPILSIALFRAMPHPIILPAATAAFAGIWLLSGGSIGTLVAGDWLTVLCAFFWSLQVIFIGRHAARSGRPVLLALVQFAVCATLGLTLAFTLEEVHWPSVLLAAPEIVFAGVFSGGMAFTLQAVGQRYTTAPQAAIMLSSEAVFAGLFATILLGERLELIGYLGCALILAAIMAVEVIPALSNGRSKRTG